MPSRTKRQASALLPVATGPSPAVPVEPPARKARGKRLGKSADADIALPVADTLAPSDVDGLATGAAKTRRLGQRRVMARRPRRAAALPGLATAPSGSIAAADSDELGEMLVGEVMGAAAVRKVGAAGATREREQQLWAQGYARVAGEMSAQPARLCRCRDAPCSRPCRRDALHPHDAYSASRPRVRPIIFSPPSGDVS